MSYRHGVRDPRQLGTLLPLRNLQVPSSLSKARQSSEVKSIEPDRRYNRSDMAVYRAPESQGLDGVVGRNPCSKLGRTEPVPAVSLTITAARDDNVRNGQKASSASRQ